MMMSPCLDQILDLDWPAQPVRAPRAILPDGAGVTKLDRGPRGMLPLISRIGANQEGWDHA